MPDAQDPHERSPIDPPSAPAWEMPSDDVLLSFAISRLIERRTALPALRHSDLGQLIQRHRIFPGFGATFLQTAPENLLRTGLGELARKRTAGLPVLAYHAAFTYSDVLTQLVDAIGPMEEPTSPDDPDDADDGAGWTCRCHCRADRAGGADRSGGGRLRPARAGACGHSYRHAHRGQL